MATYSLPTGHQYLEARVTWDYTQNANNNTSAVYARVEARRTSSYMTTNDGYSPVMKITIDGQLFESVVNYNFGAHAVNTWFDLGSTVGATVGHNADGTKSLNISTYFTTGVSNLGSLSKTQAVSLPTIPRASTISSGTDWVVGHNSEIYINRRSTDFYHSVFIDIGTNGVWQGFAERHGVGASVNTNFSEIEQGAMMDLLIVKGNPWTIQSRIRLETYNSSGYQVGTTTTITGTIYRPSESTISSQSTLELALSGVPYSLSGVNSSVFITHELKLYSGTFNKTITLANGASATGNIALTQANIDAIYALYTTQTYAPFNIELTTKLAGRQLGSKKTIATGDGSLTFNTTAVAPTFTGVPTYADTNTAITAITLNNQHIVQNKSNLKVTIPASSSTAKYGATLATYAVSVNGVEKTAAYSASAVVVDFGLVNVGSNTTAQVLVIDSRGMRTSKSIAITVYPYSNPTITGSAVRANGFDSNTTLTALGTLASVNAKNTLSSVQYRYKLTNTGTWGGYVALTPTIGTGTYTTNAPVVSLDNSLTYNLEFKVTDLFGGTATATVFLDAGKPIMFVDKSHKSVGIGKFPVNNNSLEVEGSLYVTGTSGNVYTTSKKPTPAEIGAEAVTVTGSNANGYYIKFADGTMICYGRKYLNTLAITGAWGGLFISAALSTAYPVAFVGSPASLSVNMENTTGDIAVWLNGLSSNTSFTGYFSRGQSGTFNCTMAWMAVGRWK